MRFILVLFCLLGCGAHAPLLDRPDFRVWKYPVKDADGAKEIVRARLEFLRLLYEDVVEGEFQTLKTPPECRAANEIGTIRYSGNNFVSVSRVYLGSDDVPGFCPHHLQARKVAEVFFYCKARPELLTRVTCPERECDTIRWEDQCRF